MEKLQQLPDLDEKQRSIVDSLMPKEAAEEKLEGKAKGEKAKGEKAVKGKAGPDAAAQSKTAQEPAAEAAIP